MPELPEVEVVRAGLAPAVTGAVVASVTVFDERSLRRHEGPSEDFIERLTGRVLSAPQRRGKFLWIPLDVGAASAGRPAAGVARAGGLAAGVAGAVSETQDSRGPSAHSTEHFGTGASSSPEFPTAGGTATGESEHRARLGPPAEALVVHLGMSGQVLLRDRSGEDRLTRIRLELEHPEHGPVRLNFVDQRIFGSMAIDALETARDHSDESVPGQVAHIARDPLDPRFDDARFFARLAAKNTTIKRALLDQSLISGIGNIYADEALWAARVHYDQPTATLSRPRARQLLTEVRAVLGRALAEGGTSFDTQYLNVNGEAGYFSHSLNAYGRQGLPCPRCGRAIVREQFMNRGSHFCPRCQRVR